jgi:hypothetical protein
MQASGWRGNISHRRTFSSGEVGYSHWLIDRLQWLGQRVKNPMRSDQRHDQDNFWSSIRACKHAPFYSCQGSSSIRNAAAHSYDTNTLFVSQKHHYHKLSIALLSHLDLLHLDRSITQPPTNLACNLRRVDRSTRPRITSIPSAHLFHPPGWRRYVAQPGTTWA